MNTHPPRWRIAVIDFVGIELPFVLALAEQLRDIAEFHFLQTRADTHYLLHAHRERLHTVDDTAPAALDWSDDELLEACGAHERYWADSPAALLANARGLAARVQAFIVDQRIDAVLIWNGAPLLRALAAHAAQRLGLRRLYVENGYLPGTMQLDHGGVNFYSSHTPAIAAGRYRNLPYDHAALDETLALLRSGRRPADAEPLRDPVAPVMQRLRRELGRLFTRKAWRWLLTPRDGDFATRLPDGIGRYALLPLQVVRDSQLSVHSPLFGTDLARFVTESHAALHRTRPGCRLVVKLHPKESVHGKRLHQRLAKRFPDIVFIERQPIHELLADCELVLTINSTVAVEALAFGKPVVTFGRNFYTVPALVHTVERLDALDAALHDAATQPRDAQAIRDFLGYLHQHLQVRGSYLDLSARSIGAIATRLLLLLDDAQDERSPALRSSTRSAPPRSASAAAS